MLNAERLRELLDFDAETGIFTWKVRTGRARAGARAGKVQHVSEGYDRVLIGIDGVQYKAHRLAWLYAYGKWPAETVDHINCDPTDNRLSNLREATRHQNQCNMRIQRNNTSGVKGVTWSAAHGKWIAQIKVHGKRIYLGIFKDKEDAAEARKRGVERYHGLEFGRLA